MHALRHFSVKLNDGHSMPILGFGTSAPTKVTIMALEMEAQQIGSCPELVTA